MLRRLVVATCLATLLLVGAGFTLLEQRLYEPLSLPSTGAVLEVKRGDTLRTVLAAMAQREWLLYPRVVEWWARYRELDSGLHIGEYQLQAGTTAVQLLEQLNRGDVIQYSVTLPEGITLANAIERLHSQPALVREVTGPNDPTLLELVAPYASAEGWFLPETYRYTRGDSDLDVLRRAYLAMTAELDRIWTGRGHEDLPLKNAYEALILASIVERETSVASERATIAGVFVRRLELGMRLQTDPTIIYGLGQQYDGNITRQHLRDVDNPWNTYVIKGLPPTPIALPGVAALEAAVHPEEGDALFFVAKGDGYHAFASDLRSHNANVKRYQLNRARDYKSTPEAIRP